MTSFSVSTSTSSSSLVWPSSVSISTTTSASFSSSSCGDVSSSCSPCSLEGSLDGLTSSPLKMASNSSKSMRPFPSASISVTRRSTCDGGRSARFRLRSPCFNSEESMVPSLFSSNRSNNFRMLMPVSATHCRKISTTSSATNNTPHSGQRVESRGTRAWHPPHSPSASSEMPENFVSHSGHDSESIGMTARQAPHSAIATESTSSSLILPPIITTMNGVIIIDGRLRVKGVIP